MPAEQTSPAREQIRSYESPLTKGRATPLPSHLARFGLIEEPMSKELQLIKEKNPDFATIRVDVKHPEVKNEDFILQRKPPIINGLPQPIFLAQEQAVEHPDFKMEQNIERQIEQDESEDFDLTREDHPDFVLEPDTSRETAAIRRIQETIAQAQRLRAKTERTTKLDNNIIRETTQEKKEAQARTERFKSNEKRQPTVVSEIARKKGRSTVLSDDAYRKRIQNQIPVPYIPLPPEEAALRTAIKLQEQIKKTVPGLYNYVTGGDYVSHPEEPSFTPDQTQPSQPSVYSLIDAAPPKPPAANSVRPPVLPRAPITNTEVRPPFLPIDALVARIPLAPRLPLIQPPVDASVAGPPAVVTASRTPITPPVDSHFRLVNPDDQPEVKKNIFQRGKEQILKAQAAVKEAVTQEEKLLKEPITITVGLSTVTEGKTIKELISEEANIDPPDQAFLNLKRADFTPDQAIRRLKIERMISPEDIEKDSLLMTITGDSKPIDPDKMDYLFEVFNLRKALDKLDLKASKMVTQQLDKKYGKSLEAYQQMGSIIKKENLITEFENALAKQEKSIVDATLMEAATHVPMKILIGPLRIKTAQELFQKLNARTPPALPPRSTPESLLAALSIAETYQKVADNIYAEAKGEFEKKHTLEPSEIPEPSKPPADPETPPIFGENINLAKQEKLNQEFAELKRLRDVYYKTLTTEERPPFDTSELNYKTQQHKVIVEWLGVEETAIKERMETYARVMTNGVVVAEQNWATFNDDFDIYNSHEQLKIILSDIDMNINDPEVRSVETARKAAIELYAYVKAFAVEVSDGVILDDSIDITGMTVAEIEAIYGEIRDMDESLYRLDDDEKLTFIASRMGRLGIYPRLDLDPKIKEKFDKRTATIIFKDPSATSLPLFLDEPTPAETSTPVEPTIALTDTVETFAPVPTPIETESQPASYKEAKKKVEETGEKFIGIYVKNKGEPKEEALQLRQDFDIAEKQAYKIWLAENKDRIHKIMEAVTNWPITLMESDELFSQLYDDREVNNQWFNTIAHNGLQMIYQMHNRLADYKKGMPDPDNSIPKDVDDQLMKFANELKFTLTDIIGGNVVSESLINQSIAQIKDKYGSNVDIENEQGIAIDQDDKLNIVGEIVYPGIYPLRIDRLNGIPFEVCKAKVTLKPPREKAEKPQAPAETTILPVAPTEAKLEEPTQAATLSTERTTPTPTVEAPTEPLPLEQVYENLSRGDAALKQNLEAMVASGKVTEAEVRLVAEKLQVMRGAKSLGPEDQLSRKEDRRKNYENYRKIIATLKHLHTVPDDQQELRAAQLLAVLNAKGETFDADIFTTEMQELLTIIQTLNINPQ